MSKRCCCSSVERRGSVSPTVGLPDGLERCWPGRFDCADLKVVEKPEESVAVPVLEVLAIGVDIGKQRLLSQRTLSSSQVDE